jgi:hypothetical protein
LPPALTALGLAPAYRIPTLADVRLALAILFLTYASVFLTYATLIAESARLIPRSAWLTLGSALLIAGSTYVAPDPQTRILDRTRAILTLAGPDLPPATLRS